jgi:hypothetical protein
MGIVQEKQDNHQQRKTTNPQSAELSEQVTRNLVGFFDVLIQMDLAHKQKQCDERNEKDGSNFQGTTKVAAKTD